MPSRSIQYKQVRRASEWESLKPSRLFALDLDSWHADSTEHCWAFVDINSIGLTF